MCAHENFTSEVSDKLSGTAHLSLKRRLRSERNEKKTFDKTHKQTFLCQIQIKLHTNCFPSYYPKKSHLCNKTGKKITHSLARIIN